MILIIISVCTLFCHGCHGGKISLHSSHQVNRGLYESRGGGGGGGGGGHLGIKGGAYARYQN